MDEHDQFECSPELQTVAVAWGVTEEELLDVLMDILAERIIEAEAKVPGWHVRLHNSALFFAVLGLPVPAAAFLALYGDKLPYTARQGLGAKALKEIESIRTHHTEQLSDGWIAPLEKRSYTIKKAEACRIWLDYLAAKKTHTRLNVFESHCLSLEFDEAYKYLTTEASRLKKK